MPHILLMWGGACVWVHVPASGMFTWNSWTEQRRPQLYEGTRHAQTCEHEGPIEHGLYTTHTTPCKPHNYSICAIHVHTPHGRDWRGAQKAHCSIYVTTYGKITPSTSSFFNANAMCSLAYVKTTKELTAVHNQIAGLKGTESNNKFQTFADATLKINILCQYKWDNTRAST